MRTLKILHLRDTYEIGGPGKTILETFRAIDHERFQLHLGVFAKHGDPGDSPFTTEARRLGFPVHLVWGRHSYDPTTVGRVRDLVKALQIDIVHAHEVKSDFIAYLVSWLYPVSIVTTLHGWIGNGAKDRFLGWLDKRIVRKFDRVIAVSRQIEKMSLVAGVPQEKLCMLHNAIVVERYRRTGRRGGLSEIIGRKLNCPIIASVGRLSPEKGHADLIKAIDLVRRAGEQVALVLIGDGPSRAKLVEQINVYGLQEAVHLLGYVQDPQRLLEDVDLMVLPSHTEGLPNAALEALLMEVPILATRVGGTPEVVMDKITGRLVPPHMPEALADGIRDFLANPEVWRVMAQKGKQLVKAEFDFQARTRKLETIYSEMACRA